MPVLILGGSRRAGGLPPTAIADALNLQGSRARNGVPWDRGSVEALIGLGRRIRLDDALLRAERQKTGER